MLIVGERINATRKKIGEAVKNRDTDHIKAEATKQVEAGSNYIDVNGGIPGQEVELLSWLVEVVQEAVDVPLCLDSADSEAIAAAIPKCKHPPMINSISYEKDRLENVVPLARECAGALCGYRRVSPCPTFHGIGAQRQRIYAIVPA